MSDGHRRTFAEAHAELGAAGDAFLEALGVRRLLERIARALSRR